MGGLVVYLIALVALITFSAFFSGSEAALFTLGRSQISRLEKHSRAGREIAKLLATPRALLITILIGNLVVNVFSTSAATSLAVRNFGSSGVGIAFGFMSIVILVFGEILPKALAIRQPQRVALANIYPLKFFHLIFFPAQAPITRLTDWIIESLKKRLGAARRYFSKEELLTAVDIGHKQGQLGEFEHGLLSNIIEFRDTVVKEIMTPSINVFSLPVEMSREDMEEAIVRREFSRVPVYGDTADDIRGVVHIKDIAVLAADTDVGSILRPAYYVPESTRISALFKELAKQRTQLALVIDEHGSYVGIVTMEDILEELVGEIHDAKQARTTHYTMLDDKRIIVNGTMEIDEFNQVFGADIKDEESETVAGYVVGLTGEIPNEGETIEAGTLRFHVISSQPNRIRKMRVEKHEH